MQYTRQDANTKANILGQNLIFGVREIIEDRNNKLDSVSKRLKTESETSEMADGCDNMARLHFDTRAQ
jgi:hypothetical protein